ncbi:endonuclease [Streptomyces sp. NPDC088745]|uniref:endonuclease n=1 Tax=Streptomyces sp. NPDC088745 TaxID=3365884 RepID=UPI0038224DD6
MTDTSESGQRAVVRALLDGHGRTYAAEAGIRLRDTPQPLYQLLVLSVLLSARIRSSVAVDAARELFGAGLRTPLRMADATWQQRVNALGRGGYRRYDERTSTQLGDGARLVVQEYRGDLRRLRDQARGDVAEVHRRLRKVPGIGPAGSDIFVREVQGVWPETAPYFGGKALQGAADLDLPGSPDELLRLAGDVDPGVLAAALVRAALDPKVVRSTMEQARA